MVSKDRGGCTSCCRWNKKRLWIHTYRFTHTQRRQSTVNIVFRSLFLFLSYKAVEPFAVGLKAGMTDCLLCCCPMSFTVMCIPKPFTGTKAKNEPLTSSPVHTYIRTYVRVRAHTCAHLDHHLFLLYNTCQIVSPIRCTNYAHMCVHVCTFLCLSDRETGKEGARETQYPLQNIPLVQQCGSEMQN